MKESPGKIDDMAQKEISGPKKAQRAAELRELMRLRDQSRLLRLENQTLKESNLYYRENSAHLQDELFLVNQSRLYKLTRRVARLLGGKRNIVDSFRSLRQLFRTNLPETDSTHSPGVSSKSVSVQELRESISSNCRPWTDQTVLPLISIIIVDQGSSECLKEMFLSICSANYYRNIELIIVTEKPDSEIKSLWGKKSDSFPFRFIHNRCGLSLSKSFNQGAAEAHGEYVFFMDSHVRMMDCWLDELLFAAHAHESAGVLGPHLFIREDPSASRTAGTALLHSSGLLRFVYLFIPGYGWTYRPQPCPLSKNTYERTSSIAATAGPCFLIRRTIFVQLGGFDEAYSGSPLYIDLCLRAYRAGYTNYCCTSSILYYEGSVSEDWTHADRSEVSTGQEWEYFDKRWKQWLGKRYLEDKITRQKVFTSEPLTVAFAVTETGESAVAGDLFTAAELAHALGKMGVRSIFLSGKEKQWYSFGRDVDIVVSMLQQYDPTLIIGQADHLLTVAWIRNCFDWWTEEKNADQFSVYLASSESACKYLESHFRKKVYLLPIATNFNKFSQVQNAPESPSEESFFGCDYCFTGNRFDDERKIETELYPEDTPYRFKIFGAGWEKSDRFAQYGMGHLDYNRIPLVYRYAKIVLDDANPASTREYGSINSRVFDALAAGCLVLTNNVRGAEETFKGLLPSFQDRASLNALLKKYLENESLRMEKVRELQKFVSEKHTYEIRAKEFLSYISESLKTYHQSITIMICAPNWEDALHWGDYYFAKSLRNSFERIGYQATIRVRSEWYDPLHSSYLIHLRGDTEYIPNAACHTILWNISHPNDLTAREIHKYDCAFVASNLMSGHWQKNGLQVFYLPQCTDPVIFHRSNPPEEKTIELLFVGNTRGVFRKIIQDVYPAEYQLSVFGNGWADYLPPQIIRGAFVDNDELAKLYQSSCILLNDHWEDMKKMGFVSNRIYDALASGAFVISDEVEDMDKDIKECLVTYQTKEDLREKIRYYMNYPEKREEMSARGADVVLQKYTFDHAACTISETMKRMCIII